VVERSDTTGFSSNHDPTPEGSQNAGLSGLLVPRPMLRPLRGRAEITFLSGGVASRNPRLMAGIPSGYG